mmetsp:Transcript_71425/g.187243  ORF Transcript_71425/g.187243 Transcript_71425/m.187243 type:complete len:203 (-) Transcript_71425:87-695(-)
MRRTLQAAAAAAILGLALPASALAASSSRSHPTPPPTLADKAPASALAASRSQSHPTPPPTLADKAAKAAGPSFADVDRHPHDDVVTVHEAALFGLRNGIPWGELRRLFVEVDRNGDHNMTLAEFDADMPASLDMLRSLGSSFTAVDLNGDELIDHEEWLAYCRGWMIPRPSHDKCEELFSEASGRRGDPEHVDRLEFAPSA